jgi:dipeptidyl aminopeptidase/acylaminoacyl peptidase
VISLLTQTNRFRAAASFSAYPDVEALARARDDFHLQHDVLFGGSPDANPEAWKRHSPIHHAARIKTPLLLVHDERDFIRSEQTLLLHRILTEAKVDGETILYRSRDAKDDAGLIERVFAWFAVE